MFSGMSVTQIAPDYDTPDRDDRPNIDMTGTRTPLAEKLNSIQAVWLISHICDRWEALHRCLGDWRGDMKRWEEMSLEDYRSRIGSTDPTNTGIAKTDIFSRRNSTLGLTAGFWDFFVAQAKNDIFGTRPWLSASPEGRSDIDLAKKITKHANWKLSHSNFEPVAVDALNIAGWGGTSFVKLRWREDEEEYQEEKHIAVDPEGTPIMDPETRDYITDPGRAAELGMDGNLFQWERRMVENVVSVYDNIRAELVEWKDVAFDITAPELDLYETDVFTRFRMGVLDAIRAYELSEEQISDLAIALAGGEDTESPITSAGMFGLEDNPPIDLVEGFVRCDPFQTGKPVRIHCIFSPALRILFSVDYLANVTPSGILPVFPVRIHKQAGRILGIGWFEKYEHANNAVDRQYNGILIRNEEGVGVMSGVQPDALLDQNKVNSLKWDPMEPVVLAPGKKMTDLIDFAVFPNPPTDSDKLLNMMMQMAQMRSGITSAAQGELSGVPTANTATGVREMMTRGATLLKAQIDQATQDMLRCAEAAVYLIYSNHDHAETFVWGEGEDAELLSIEPNDVRGLKMNVTLTLVQAQNAQKLQSSQLGIEIYNAWLMVPEEEKAHGRPLFIQAVSSLGFRNADDIIRSPMAAMGMPMAPGTANTGGPGISMAVGGHPDEPPPGPQVRGAPQIPDVNAAPVSPAPTA